MEYDVATQVRNALEFTLDELGSSLQEFAASNLLWVKENVIPRVVGLLRHLPENDEQISELVHKQWGELKGELITQEVYRELATTR